MKASIFIINKDGQELVLRTTQFENYYFILSSEYLLA